MSTRRFISVTIGLLLAWRSVWLASRKRFDEAAYWMAFACYMSLE